ncbi:MAG TPA: 50S ribosomal protein L9 [Myxococcota bacterium]|nr:50S ribosomal protein L9 [Myxococcota bacterium]
MEVILTEKRRHLGNLGDKVKVKPGFARNFLIPQGKAVYATKENVAMFEAKRAEHEKAALERQSTALERQAALQALPPFTIAAKTAEGGKLFGSIGIREVVEVLKTNGVMVEKREVSLPQGALRLVGDYDITIDLGGDVIATVKISIVPQG